MTARLVLVALLAGACGSDPAPAPAPELTRSSASVRWRPARSAERTALLEAPAKVLPATDGRAVVTAPLRARIVAVSARAGDEVAAGAPLVEVAMPEAAAAAAEYLAAVDQLAAHEKRAAQLAELRKEGLSRTSDLAAIELEVARLRGTRDIAATTLRTAGLALADARALAARGGRLTLRAPRAGVLTRVTAVVGAIASPDEALAEIAGGGSTRVEVTLAHPLPQGARFELELATGASPARLVALAPSRESDGSTRAWFEVDTPAPAGALGRLRAIVPRGTAVSVPATAVATDDAGTYVWRREGDTPKRLAVRVLVTSGADALVAGPAEGDSIASVAASVEDVP